MKKDILEKSAILQRDRETYAIAPHIPGGITDTTTLRKGSPLSVSGKKTWTTYGRTWRRRQAPLPASACGASRYAPAPRTANAVCRIQ